ncbi:hypothetical protein V6N11_069263 [Hibiscus sabdariffa]|uniref:Uncharacterized protein n=1 Tax=Hibiscus sabdariffa TaxID=183260 RepID=A0ABR2NB83_9ROSI
MLCIKQPSYPALSSSTDTIRFVMSFSGFEHKIPRNFVPVLSHGSTEKSHELMYDDGESRWDRWNVVALEELQCPISMFSKERVRRSKLKPLQRQWSSKKMRSEFDFRVSRSFSSILLFVSRHRRIKILLFEKSLFASLTKDRQLNKVEQCRR